MTKRDQILLASLIGSGLGLWLIGQVHAQPAERVDRGTQQWAIIPVAGDRIRLRVIETSGVCLYLANDYTATGVAIAAVPKTQLPPGTGCQ